MRRCIPYLRVMNLVTRHDSAFNGTWRSALSAFRECGWTWPMKSDKVVIFDDCYKQFVDWQSCDGPAMWAICWRKFLFIQVRWFERERKRNIQERPSDGFAGIVSSTEIVLAVTRWCPGRECTCLQLWWESNLALPITNWTEHILFGGVQSRYQSRKHTQQGQIETYTAEFMVPMAFSYIILIDGLFTFC